MRVPVAQEPLGLVGNALAHLARGGGEAREQDVAVAGGVVDARHT